MSTLNLPYGVHTFLLHKSIIPHLHLPPRWYAYLTPFHATSPRILPTPLTARDIATSLAAYNMEVFRRDPKPFGSSRCELFLLQQGITIGDQASLMQPTPFMSPPPARCAPPGFNKEQLSALRAL